MSTHSICFYGEIMKIIHKLSSNILICFTVCASSFSNQSFSETDKEGI